MILPFTPKRCSSPRCRSHDLFICRRNRFGLRVVFCEGCWRFVAGCLDGMVRPC